MKILVTGAAGFVGSYYLKKLIDNEHEVIGLDNYNSYYNPNLKIERTKALFPKSINVIKNIDLTNQKNIDEVFKTFKPQVVIHLAAQAGVRLPIQEYGKYTDSNIIGFINICEAVAKYEVKNFLFASSSSVYGNSLEVPFKENNRELNPVSIYGVTKLFNEHYSEIFFKNSITKVIALRFFTVYGPWGRPDMAYFRILSSLLKDEEFSKFGDGNLKRDFTYVEDTVNSIYLLMKMSAIKPMAEFEIFNIGGGHPYSLNDLINEFEEQFKKKLKIKQLPSSALDVKITHANYDKLEKFINFVPSTKLEEGVGKILKWSSLKSVEEKIPSWGS